MPRAVWRDLMVSVGWHDYGLTANRLRFELQSTKARARPGYGLAWRWQSGSGYRRLKLIYYTTKHAPCQTDVGRYGWGDRLDESRGLRLGRPVRLLPDRAVVITGACQANPLPS